MIYYALLLFFLFEYLRPGNYVPGLDALMLNALIPFTAILGTLVLKTPVSNRQFFVEGNTKMMAVLLVMLSVSTLFATVTMTAYTVTKTVFMNVLIYWVIVRQVGDARRLKGVFMSLTFVHILVAVLNPRLFTDPDSRVGINSGAFIGDGNDFALSVNLCIPLALFLLFETRRKLSKIVWLVILLTLVFCVIATKSRGGTLGLVAVGLYYWLRSDRKLLMAGLGAVSVVLVLAVAPPSYYARMATMTDTEESSAKGRIDAWKEGFNMAVRSPLIGMGPGHFGMAYGNANQSRWVTAHSVYFLLLGELGFPGLMWLISLIVANLMANRKLLTAARRLPRDDAATATNILTSTSAALVSFAVGGAFLSAAYYPHLYVISGVLVAGRHIVREQIAAHEAGAAVTTDDAQIEGLPVRQGTISPEWKPRPALGASHFSGD